MTTTCQDRSRDSLGAGTTTRLASFGALLLGPDFLPQGLEAALLAQLERLELAVVAAIPRILTLHDTSTIYSPSLASRARDRRPSSWLSLSLFELGGSVLLVVHGPAAGSSVQARINAHKGPSSYVERVPESIRGMSPIAERYFSLVHSPDEPTELVALCEQVMGGAGLELLLASEPEPVPEDALVLLLGSTPLRQESHPFDVLFRCMAVALAGMVADPRVPRPARPHEALTAVATVRRSLRHVARGEPLVRAAMDALVGLTPVMRQARDRLRDLPSPEGWRELGVANARRELGEVLAAACEPGALGLPLVEALLELLGRNHHAIDDFTRHRLRVLSALHGAGGD